MLTTMCNENGASLSLAVRPAAPEDAAALLDIYAPYVRETAITFEYEVPSLEELRGRIRRTLERYPYLVAEAERTILGYAYTGVFKGRAAYDWSAETTIYLRTDQRGKGVGRRLYRALEEVSKAQNLRNLYACVAYPEKEDGRLTKASAEFHARMGYRLVGEFRRCGYKFGTWYNMVWMEKLIGGHPAEPGPFIPFSALPPELFQHVL